MREKYAGVSETDMTIRERTQEIERLTLCGEAMLSENTRGRQRQEAECEIRTPFQRDRDRIIHSKAFRRLKHKTQVFITPEGDHYRTRLTHTLEVSQIARSIARGLRLNEDLTEAIALGHDLGHTPFGHAGERALNRVHEGGFEHNRQSIRVVETENGKGLNLCYEVKDGILNHRSKDLPITMEGQVVRFSDKFAYINHDIDDALRAGIITEQDLPANCRKTLGESCSERIDTLVKDVIHTGFVNGKVAMTPEVADAVYTLRRYMHNTVYIGSVAKTEEGKAEHIVETLYTYFCAHREKLPEDEQKQIERFGISRVVCDYIAGMSDSYAVHKFEEIFVPKAWTVF